MEVISKDFCLANLTEPYKEIYTIPFLTEDFCKSVLAEAYWPNLFGGFHY